MTDDFKVMKSGLCNDTDCLTKWETTKMNSGLVMGLYGTLKRPRCQPGAPKVLTEAEAYESELLIMLAESFDSLYET